MRILTVRQPWAWAIIHGGKTVENRVRNIAGSYRGPVLIHAGLKIERETTMPFDAIAIADRRPAAYPTGAIIGVVDLVDVHRVSWDGTCDGEGLCSPWSDADGWPTHLVFENPRALDEPIPYKGALGLRKTDFAVVGDYLTAPWGHGNRSCTPYGCEPYCELEPVGKLLAVTS